MTVEQYCKWHLGMTDQEYANLITSMRVVDPLDVFTWAYTGELSPGMHRRLAPMPTPKEIFYHARRCWRAEMHVIDQGC